MSHELRTPLTAVRGYVEALADADPEESRRFLEIVARHTMRMERLVRDLLRLARLDAGQELLERVPCSVENLFSAVETDLANLLTARRQVVVRTVSPDAATVPGDPAKVQDALRNLLENATNYSPEGSTIVMAHDWRGAEIAITVSDDGPGIPEADLPRVFERFYRVDKSRTRARETIRAARGWGWRSSSTSLSCTADGSSPPTKPDPRGDVPTIELPPRGSDPASRTD